MEKLRNDSNNISALKTLIEKLEGVSLNSKVNLLCF